jgi:hypothetical protein
VLEKTRDGLGPVAEILENYGIDSETDLLVLDQDDFRKLDSKDIKPELQHMYVCVSHVRTQNPGG